MDWRTALWRPSCTPFLARFFGTEYFLLIIFSQEKHEILQYWLDYINMIMFGKLPTLDASSPRSVLLSKLMFSYYVCMYIEHINVRWMLSNFRRYHFQDNVDTATKEKRGK
jgi:hypothetical protein